MTKSARQYQIFDLHVLQGLSVGEAARLFRVSMASVYMAKYRLSRLLRRESERLDASRRRIRADPESEPLSQRVFSAAHALRQSPHVAG